MFVSDAGPIGGLRPERGTVMDFFVQLELMVNQIFVVHIVGRNDEVGKFEQLLDAVDLFSKIRFLQNWGLIDSRTKEMLLCLKEVRNGFAHHWDMERCGTRVSPYWHTSRNLRWMLQTFSVNSSICITVGRSI